MTMKGLTLFLSHFLQTEVDDSGSQAEPNQGDRSPPLRGNRTQVSRDVTACQSLRGPQTPPQLLLVCATSRFLHSEVSISGVRVLAHALELAALELASTRADGLRLG